jgi:hypothetical protein
VAALRYFFPLRGLGVCTVVRSKRLYEKWFSEGISLL